jgi:oxygen-dependent protoporphyrinogen oxidase
LLEASDRVGGVISTSKQDGFIIEHGPDAFISTKPWAQSLSQELGIADKLIGTNPKERRSFVLRKGRLHPVPEGFYMMAPGSLWPFVKTPIFSWRGKLRMALDLVIPRSRTDADESLERFVVRRLGKEAFTRMAQPMVGGVYTADPTYLSLKATMPQFLEMEQKHGSIIKALLARKQESKQKGKLSEAKSPPFPPFQRGVGGIYRGGTSGPRYSLFLSFEAGMQTLIDTLIKRLPADCIQLGCAVSHIEYAAHPPLLPPSRAGGGTSQKSEQGGWRIHLDNQQHINADIVCIALPAPRAATVVKTVAPELSDLLARIPYASSATVNLAFRRKNVGHPLNGMGFVVPAIEGRSILACSFSSVKFEGRAPADYALLRAFVGGALQEERFLQSESDIIESALTELREWLGIKAEPIHAVVSKHANAMAQYHLGHLEAVSQIEAQARKLPGLALAGNAYHGIGVPDCIHSAEKAAYALLESLTD